MTSVIKFFKNPLKTNKIYNFSVPGTRKGNQKSIKEAINFLFDFYIDFGSILAAKLAPIWLNLAPITAQERPKRRLGGSLVASGSRLGAKNPPRAAQEPTLWAQDRFFLDLGFVLGPILVLELTKIAPRLLQDS